MFRLSIKLTILIMPNWARTDPDTAPILRYIHLAKLAGQPPDRDQFKASREGQALVAKRGLGKVNCCWKQTIGRYDDFRAVGGGMFCW